MLSSQQLDRQLIDLLTRLVDVDAKSLHKYTRDLEVIEASATIMGNIVIYDAQSILIFNRT
ncbi:MAG: hypothetical protein MHMPM18_004054 [Marteilia pararefringens]